MSIFLLDLYLELIGLYFRFIRILNLNLNFFLILLQFLKINLIH